MRNEYFIPGVLLTIEFLLQWMYVVHDNIDDNIKNE